MARTKEGEPKKERLNFTIDPEVADLLRDMAKNSKLPMSKILEVAIVHFHKTEGKSAIFSA